MMKDTYIKRYESGRYSLIAMAAFTLVNIVLLFFGSDLYFIFSASIPYFTAIFPWVLAIEDPSYTAFVVPMTLAAVLMLVPYVLAFFLGKRPEKYGWMILALVCFAIDTVGFFVLFGISIDGIIDLVFHGWILVSLVLAVVSAVKLKSAGLETVEIKMPETEQAASDSESQE